MEDGGGVKWVVGVRGNLFLPSLILECGGKEPLFLARDHEINTRLLPYTVLQNWAFESFHDFVIRTVGSVFHR